MKAFNRITFSPTIMAGQACTKGLRITVSLILSLVVSGKATDEIIANYSDLE